MGELLFAGRTAFKPSGQAAFTPLRKPGTICAVKGTFSVGVSTAQPMRTHLLLATCLFAAFTLSAQPKAFASLQPERIVAGDTTSLILLVSGLNAEPKEVDFSPWTAVFPPANIIGRTDWRRSGTQWTRRFTLIAFDRATIELPPLKVRLSTGKPLETNALTLSVFTIDGGREISDMAKIRDIRREPESWVDYWPWGLGLIATLVLLIWWLRKNQRRPQPMAAPLPISGSEWALQQLSDLDHKQLCKNGQAKEHYAELSLILRRYLEMQYGIAALESTTAEIHKMLAATDCPAGARSEVRKLLQKTDMVKYARSEPLPTAHEEVLAKAREMVAPHQFKKAEQTRSDSDKLAPTEKPAIGQRPPSGKYEPL